MNTTNFDWRWITVILIVLYLIARPSLSPVTVVIGAVGAGWLLQTALTPWRTTRNVLGSSKVTYWRGQRIVTKQSASARIRSVSTLQVLLSVWYFVLGLGCAYATIIVFTGLVGLF